MSSSNQLVEQNVVVSQEQISSARVPKRISLFKEDGTALNLEQRYYFRVEDYGKVDPTGVVDSSPAIQAAIDAAKFSSTGGVVYLSPGTYKIDTTLDLSNIHPSAGQYGAGVAVTLRGAGKYITTLIGGETGYGFVDLVGTNRARVEGLAMITTGTLQYGILLGRKSGDGSAGEHVFQDLLIYGAFTLGAIFSMSSEINIYRDVIAYTTSGRPMMLVRENTYGAVAKHTPLSTSAPISGGNGLNRFEQVQLLTTSNNTTDYPLTLEYVQTFSADGLYIWSDKAVASIYMAKLCSGASFRGLHQECGVTTPNGFHISAAGASPSSPDFRGISIKSSRVFPFYAEDGSRVVALDFDSQWRGVASWQLDVATLWDSSVHFDPRATSVSTNVSNPQYRVRTNSAGNEWGPNDTTTANRPSAVYRGVGATMFDTDTKQQIISDGAQWLDVGPSRPDFLEHPTVGEVIPPRDVISVSNVSHTSGTVALSYFTAKKTEVINSLTAYTGATPAAPTPSHCSMGVYEIDSSGNGTLLASTTNDTSLFATANTAYTKTLNTSWNKVAGRRYALAVLVVSAAAVPSYYGPAYLTTSLMSTLMAVEPRRLARILSQTSLPASFVPGGLTDYNARSAIRVS